MQWEYQVVNVFDKSWMGGVVDGGEVMGQLNALGAQGWELVSAFDTNQGHGASRAYVFILKRPRTAQTGNAVSVPPPVLR
jgi:hypothetical protein